MDLHHLTYCVDAAVTLLHELGHAANLAISGGGAEPFYEDSVVAEAGFEIVSRLFGANADIDMEDDVPSVFFAEWPRRDMVQDYQEGGQSLLCRDISLSLIHI